MVCPFGQVAEAPSQLTHDRERDRGLVTNDGLEVPRGEGETGRRTVRHDLGYPRTTVEDGELAEELARAKPRDDRRRHGSPARRR